MTLQQSDLLSKINVVSTPDRHGENEATQWSNRTVLWHLKKAEPQASLRKHTACLHVR